MKKAEFLRELKARISVLEQSEQDDILAEYTQHIDLRVEGGLTEEQAILDFGDLDQLTAEILEAYHVDPDAGVLSSPAAKGEGPGPLRRFGQGFVRMMGAIGGAVTGFFSAIGRGLGRGWRSFTGLFHRSKGTEPQRSPIEPPQQRGTGFWHRCSSACGRGLQSVGRLCAFLLRLGWNGLLLLAALPLGILLLLTVIVLGLLLTLVIQGFPLVGVALVCLGGTLCLAALLILGSDLRCSLHPTAETVPAEQEVNHEKAQ